MKIFLPKIIETGPLVKVGDGHYEQKVVYEVTDEMVWSAFIYWLKMGSTGRGDAYLDMA